MRLKAKFLTVVWGDAYIELFATLALPSFLAPGNLPALAAATDLEVVIMTAQRDIEHFDKHFAFRRLRDICAVRFLDIDDLIVDGVYGVTLTLAYARAVIACGHDMLHTHFVFMNADFVLADGSLRSLSKHILAGRSIVLAPSFRATAEAVEPRLRAEVDVASGQLIVSPRRLAGISLEHPHPTTIAKIVNQEICHSVQPNQFFWQVDKQTLLGRYYLIFMLCLKPERIVERINSYCDYGFIPEMCPSGDEVVMGDSDEFFMLELQQRDQELFLLRRGRQPDKDIARSLSQWTTAEHRRAASYDVVFHAGDLPSKLDRAKAEARAFVERIGERLGRPVPHAAHPHWVGGIIAFRRFRRARGLRALPAEMAETSGIALNLFAFRSVWRRILDWPRSLVLASHHLIMGWAPRVTPLHPDWLDYLHLRTTLAAIVAEPGARVLLVQEKAQLADDLGSPGASLSFATPREVSRGKLSSASGDLGDGYTHILIYSQRTDYRQTRQLVEQCQPAMNAKCTCYVFVHHSRDDTAGDDSLFDLMDYFEGKIVQLPPAHPPVFTMAQYLEAVNSWAPQAVALSFAGGRLKQFNRRLLTRLSRHYARFGNGALLWIVPALTTVLPLALLTNIYLRGRLPSSHFIQYCSSMLLRIGPGAGVSTQLEQPRQFSAVAPDEFALQVPPRNRA